MPGRVTRKNNLRRNRGAIEHSWLLLGNLPPGHCDAKTHEKETARLVAEFQLFGPWVGRRELPECGCVFITLPACAL